MGTSLSHRMEDRDNRSDDTLGSQVQESELTAILRFLISRLDILRNNYKFNII